MVASEQGVVESPTLALEITVWKAAETKIALVGVVEAVDSAMEEMLEVNRIRVYLKSHYMKIIQRNRHISNLISNHYTFFKVVVVEDTEVAALVQGGLGLQVPAMAGITILVEEEEQMIGGETKILSIKK